MKYSIPSVEELEHRELLTLVFVFNGNAFAAAKPNALTQATAADLQRHGDRAVQFGYPALSNANQLNQIAYEIEKISKGQPVGLVGFSAGGALALRLAGYPSLKVKDVLNFYGPPDMRDWLSQHYGDIAYQYVTSHVSLEQSIISKMSGTCSTAAHIVNAFGEYDVTVVAGPSATSATRDFPRCDTYFYSGAHGVGLDACGQAYQDFLAHL